MLYEGSREKTRVITAENSAFRGIPIILPIKYEFVIISQNNCILLWLYKWSLGEHKRRKNNMITYFLTVVYKMYKLSNIKHWSTILQFKMIYVD